MARQVQIIRGTTEQNDDFTGATGAMTYVTDTKGLRVHDGSTQGGIEIPTAAMADYVIYWDNADATDHSHAKPGVPTPTNFGWYRYYKSGWVEQGGFITHSATGTIELIIPLTSAPVCVHLISVDNTGTPWQGAQCNVEYNYSGSSGTVIAFNANDGRTQTVWDVAGQAQEA